MFELQLSVSQLRLGLFRCELDFCDIFLQGLVECFEFVDLLLQVVILLVQFMVLGHDQAFLNQNLLPQKRDFLSSHLVILLVLLLLGGLLLPQPSELIFLTESKLLLFLANILLEPLHLFLQLLELALEIRYFMIELGLVELQVSDGFAQVVG